MREPGLPQGSLFGACHVLLPTSFATERRLVTVGHQVPTATEQKMGIPIVAQAQVRGHFVDPRIVEIPHLVPHFSPTRSPLSCAKRRKAAKRPVTS